MPSRKMDHKEQLFDAATKAQVWYQCRCPINGHDAEDARSNACVKILEKMKRAEEIGEHFRVESFDAYVRRVLSNEVIEEDRRYFGRPIKKAIKKEGDGTPAGSRRIFRMLDENHLDNSTDDQSLNFLIAQFLCRYIESRNPTSLLVKWKKTHRKITVNEIAEQERDREASDKAAGVKNGPYFTDKQEVRKEIARERQEWLIDRKSEVAQYVRSEVKRFSRENNCPSIAVAMEIEGHFVFD